MIPDQLHITVIIGGRNEYGFEMVSAIDGTPVDLTGCGPWKAQVRRTPDEEVVTEFYVSEDDPSNGLISMSIAQELTTGLVEQTNRWDLIDSHGRMWICGLAPTSKKITR